MQNFWVYVASQNDPCSLYLRGAGPHDANLQAYRKVSHAESFLHHYVEEMIGVSSDVIDESNMNPLVD